MTGASEREPSTAAANERLLVRLGYDLHDGPLQQVYALAQDVRLLRDQMVMLVGSEHREPVVGRFADLESQLAELHQDLRDLAHSLEPRSLLEQPLPDAVGRELTTLSRRTGISTSIVRHGSFDALSASQRIALLRVLQEALSNIKQHSGSRAVAVSCAKMPSRASAWRSATTATASTPKASCPTRTARAASASRACVSACGCSAADSRSRADRAGRRSSERDCPAGSPRPQRLPETRFGFRTLIARSRDQLAPEPPDDPDVHVRPAIGTSLTRLLGTACAVACAVSAALASPPEAAALEPCGKAGYSYAGFQSANRGHGVKATLVALAKPDVRSGHVAAWVGVGGAGLGPNGSDQWLQVGLSAFHGTGSNLYYEVTTGGAPARYHAIDAQVSGGNAIASPCSSSRTGPTGGVCG